MKVIFRGPAVEDVIEAAAWYEAQAPGLGDLVAATRRNAVILMKIDEWPIAIQAS